MNKEKTTRVDARQILKNGILNMSVERLIQMSRFGLIGNIFMSNELAFTKNSFNHIEYDEENEIITFLVGESGNNYGSISFMLDAITDISGCENKENPDERLDINIKLENGTTIEIDILY